MRPEYFNYLLEIHHHHSISAAAHALHIGQTTLSSIVRSVEKELGFPIFLRSPAGVATTMEGERFMDLAWEICVRFDQLKSLKSREEDNARPIRVLMSPCVNVGLAVPLSTQFSAFELRGDLAIEEQASTDIVPDIIRDDANIGVTHLSASAVETILRQEHRTLQIECLYQDRACLLLPPGHRLSNHTAIRLSDLDGERLATITGFRTVHNQSFLDALIEHARQSISFPNMSAMGRAVREENMVGVTTWYAMQSGGICPACQAIPFDAQEDERGIMSICVVYRIDRCPRYQEQILLSCIRDYFQDFSSKHGG